MRACILSIGSELMRGELIDTNAAYLAMELTQLGFEVVRVATYPDTLADLEARRRPLFGHRAAWMADLFQRAWRSVIVANSSRGRFSWRCART